MLAELHTRLTGSSDVPDLLQTSLRRLPSDWWLFSIVPSSTFGAKSSLRKYEALFACFLSEKRLRGRGEKPWGASCHHSAFAAKLCVSISHLDQENQDGAVYRPCHCYTANIPESHLILDF